jgi:hypothetical protein
MNDIVKVQPADGLARMREPFLAHQISKLPKGTKTQNMCLDAEKVNCAVCGGWHHPKIRHLDYVGHAAVTDRLLDCDPAWTWEPLACGPDGLPALDADGGMWIRLTICGVTRLGYGNAKDKDAYSPGDRMKECIGDAIRNVGMRFGAALELWHKGDLHLPEPEDDDDDSSDWLSAIEAATTVEELRKLKAVIIGLPNINGKDMAKITNAWNARKAALSVPA